MFIYIYRFLLKWKYNCMMLNSVTKLFGNSPILRRCPDCAGVCIREVHVDRISEVSVLEIGEVSILERCPYIREIFISERTCL